MDLIIKPTELCNFACTFCSSNKITQDNAGKRTFLKLETIYQFLERFPQTNTIIVNGGDPLMMSPDYYWQIVDYLETRQLPASLSLTTNLWDFYLHPDKWADLFRLPRVGVATSFHYGHTRRLGSGKVYAESLFWKVSDCLLKHVGYRPDFISVISGENESKALDNVYLAKKMQVECKLNNALASGRQGRPYQLSKMYHIYLQVIERGLAPWEYNSKALVDSMQNLATACPRHRHCDQGIRCLQPEGDYYSCGSFADDFDYPIDFAGEMQADSVQTPLQDDFDLSSFKAECFGCALFSLCNGCRKSIKDHKRFGMVEAHCQLMKTLEDKIALLTGVP